MNRVEKKVKEIRVLENPDHRKIVQGRTEKKSSTYRPQL
jgi:hypothetical protein